MATMTLSGSRPLPAAGSSFYAAMRILPPTRRSAMYAIYAFCRAVDDIADSNAPCVDRVSGLEEWRADVDALFSGQTPERLLDLAAAVGTFGLRRSDFVSIIDGMLMDARGNLIAPDWQTLDVYCDCVASAVGRLSVRVFGLDTTHGDALAHHLGRALQLTNILRDIDEDAALGRLYLPREALLAAGIGEFNPKVVLSHPKLGEACTHVADQAAAAFQESDRIMTDCPRASVRTPRVMASAYSSILAELQARGWNPPREPIHVSRLRLIGTYLRYCLV